MEFLEEWTPLHRVATGQLYNQQTEEQETGR
jgi:hypothetical protein